MMEPITVDTQTGIELLYRSRDLEDYVFDTEVAEIYNRVAYDLDLPRLSTEPDWNTEFDIPEKYRNIDVEEYLHGLIPESQDQTDKLASKARVDLELALYKSKNLYPVLQLMIYIVDTLRENNIVWGVGRGSSVASYCLYLIGVHRVNSIQYGLDIHEFLR